MNQKNNVFQYVLAYLLLLITLALALLSASTILTTIENINALWGMHRYPNHAIKLFLTFGLGIALLVVLIVGEHLYRTGIKQRKLWIHFCRFSGTILAITGVIHLVYVGSLAYNGIYDPIFILLTVVEMAAAIGLRWWRQKLLAQRKSY